MVKEYRRSLELLCPTCASALFDFDETENEAMQECKCVGCGGRFNKEQLMEANASRINSEIENIGKELLDDALSDFKKSFPKSKIFKLK